MILTDLKTLIAGLAVLIAASPVSAEGPKPGCYMRDYTEAHLAKHPAQVVDKMSLRVFDDGNSNILADMFVTLTRQGHVAGTPFAGETEYQFLLCFDYQGQAGCTVECDGGNFFVVGETTDTLTIETSYLTVGYSDECGGSVDLAEVPGQPVRYRLMKAEPGACPAFGE